MDFVLQTITKMAEQNGLSVWCRGHSNSVIFNRISSNFHIGIASIKILFKFEYWFCLLNENQDGQQNSLHLSVCTNGDRELIIYPIDPNGETLVFCSLFCISQHMLAITICSSLNMNKGKKTGKNIPSPAFFFNYCMLCNGCHILGKALSWFKLEITIFTFWSRKTQYKCIW